MKLIVLGSGTCVPSLKRNAPGYYLEGGGKRLIVDCGSGTLLQLLKAGKSYKDIDALFITHTHPDHVSGLVPFIHALAATPGYERTRDISIIGPDGIKQFYERCVSSVIRKPRSFSINLSEIDEKMDIGNLNVFAVKTVHSDNSIAFRFEEEGKSVVMTGDCDFDEELIKFSLGADLLVIDCSYPDKLKVPGHLDSTECGLIAERAGVKKILLSHIYPSPYPDHIRLTECRAVFGGDVLLAEDLMEFAI
ncbi:ribonuclease Z [bacterium BMS3Abin07]|nr:ribonuclease Z [bacterium BMS3Abin07]GBE31355.1 ribonuclease Z [bacterium BMS3Bbin05]HDO23274.1 MBL fold metallo-hydrolase [Nitrospirota bacterium]